MTTSNLGVLRLDGALELSRSGFLFIRERLHCEADSTKGCAQSSKAVSSHSTPKGLRPKAKWIALQGNGYRPSGIEHYGAFERDELAGCRRSAAAPRMGSDTCRVSPNQCLCTLLATRTASGEPGGVSPRVFRAAVRAASLVRWKATSRATYPRAYATGNSKLSGTELLGRGMQRTLSRPP